MDDINMHIAIAAAAVRLLRESAGQKLWLWRNGDHYWASDNKYPCDESGDPMTLGEPVGFAVFKPSRSSRR